MKRRKIWYTGCLTSFFRKFLIIFNIDVAKIRQRWSDFEIEVVPDGDNSSGKGKTWMVVLELRPVFSFFFLSTNIRFRGPFQFRLRAAWSLKQMWFLLLIAMRSFCRPSLLGKPEPPIPTGRLVYRFTMSWFWRKCNSIRVCLAWLRPGNSPLLGLIPLSRGVRYKTQQQIQEECIISDLCSETPSTRGSGSNRIYPV